MAEGRELAADQLELVERIQASVRAHGVQAHVPYLAWALWLIIFLPPFDFVSGDIWGPVVLVASAGGTVATFNYFHHRQQRVRLLPRPPWGWAAWGLWYGGLFIGAELAHVHYRWTIVAAAASLPLAAFAAWSLRTTG
ncbi:MAG: hypothetical protein M3083_19735 [Actinomycetota bacterium]|nr:hypothetical protein [Actinomycetota bacterium]